MKRLITLLLLMLCFASCTDEDAGTPERALVFSGEVLEDYDAPAKVKKFPAEHGGTAVSHSLLENGMTAQAEIASDGAVMTEFWCNVLDDGGNRILSLEPAEDLGHELSVYNVSAGNIFSMTDALALDDGYILVTTAGVCAYDTAGNLTWTIDDPDGKDVILYEEWLILLCTGAEEVLYTVNRTDGRREEIPLDGDMQEIFGTLGDGDILFTGADGALYTANDTGLYRITLTENGNPSRRMPNRLRTGFLPGFWRRRSMPSRWKTRTVCF